MGKNLQKRRVRADLLFSNSRKDCNESRDTDTHLILLAQLPSHGARDTRGSIQTPTMALSLTHRRAPAGSRLSFFQRRPPPVRKWLIGLFVLNYGTLDAAHLFTSSASAPSHISIWLSRIPFLFCERCFTFVVLSVIFHMFNVVWHPPSKPYIELPYHALFQHMVKGRTQTYGLAWWNIAKIVFSY